MIRLVKKFDNNLVYDGEDQGFYKNITFTIDEDLIVNIEVLRAKYFNSLGTILSESEFENIKISHNVKPSESFPNAYVSENNFPQRFQISENGNQKVLVLLSFGEFQPGRYKIFIEGVWEII